MSDAIGAVRFADGLVLFYLYAGTSDTCTPALFPAVNDPWKQKDGGWDRLKLCTHSEPVEIFSSYGGGARWNGTACRACMVIVDDGSRCDGMDHYTPNKVRGGQPDWFKSAIKEKA